MLLGRRRTLLGRVSVTVSFVFYQSSRMQKRELTYKAAVPFHGIEHLVESRKAISRDLALFTYPRSRSYAYVPS
jgi:hypothetical protein